MTGRQQILNDKEVGARRKRQPATAELRTEQAAATAALLPGQYVSARILTGRAPHRTLPEDALLPGGEVSYAYYQVKSDAKGSTFRRFYLRPGPTDQGQAAVRLLDALADTTQLVVRGAYFLDAERSKGQGGDE